MDHEPKTRVLITGAASGLGRALALAWANRGAKILIADIHAERGAESVALCLQAGAAEAHYLHLDVGLESDFIHALQWTEQHWGGLDTLVNNAGVVSAGAFDGIPEADWLWMLNINLLGAVRGCRVFTPLFKQQKHGQFINIASMAGLLNPPSMASYNVAKAGVIALSETLSAELCPWNIKTLVVCPSFFSTHLNESLRSHDESMKITLAKLMHKNDLTADDIALGIMQAIDNGEQQYLPHVKAGQAWQLKCDDPEKHHEAMRAQAMKTAGHH